MTDSQKIEKMLEAFRQERQTLKEQGRTVAADAIQDLLFEAPQIVLVRLYDAIMKAD
jgi:hypothetical protein